MSAAATRSLRPGARCERTPHPLPSPRQLEQGKDITRPRRLPRLPAKAGDHPQGPRTFGKSRMIALPQHPDIPAEVAHGHSSRRPLKDPLQDDQDWKRRGSSSKYSPLELTDRTLSWMFLDTHGEVLLSTPTDPERFLRLFLADKNDVSPGRLRRIRRVAPPSTRPPGNGPRSSALASAAIWPATSSGVPELALPRRGRRLADGVRAPARSSRIFPLPQVVLADLDICISAWETASEDRARGVTSPRSGDSA